MLFSKVQGESIATASLLYEAYWAFYASHAELFSLGCWDKTSELFKATKDPIYVEKYVCLWQYCWEHWVDHEHGGAGLLEDFAWAFNLRRIWLLSMTSFDEYSERCVWMSSKSRFWRLVVLQDVPRQQALQ